MTITSKIGLGTVQFGLKYGITNKGGKTHPSEVGDILRFAIENGIEYLDTASAYGDSERVLGQTRLLNNFRLVSKFMPSTDGQTVREQFDNSCSQLQTSSLYGYLAHRPMALLDNYDDWIVLEELKRNGRITKIGFSLYDPNEFDLLMERNIIPDIVQVPLNYFDNRFDPLLGVFKELGCEVHVRSIFLQGLFFSNVDTLPLFFDEVKLQIQNLQHLYGYKLPNVLLKYVLEKPLVDIVIIGVETLKQLKGNLMGIEELDNIPTLNIEVSDRILTPSKWIQR